mmetsp:Transcript_19820/g.25518  ORF Transcript_19820/g.25518 Transcript_19820/m.25518 type:complete len:126 (+) Transcript_19820:176-553(+)|eukprot:CAMPEP_0198139620 /NCGR_PEP_ID=MMETSP1443-20131203/2897_1 /TAXON_ID=186043 /ORGANISM="Entomoneis sp., Strain CCMP2396" /LENGTH=125 /DNA_ID=CAMNT_0043801803 /DNA_START=108 /DNA_END=485 /DNA_ORIENTATION=-
MVLRFLLVRLVVMTSFLMALNEGFSVVSKPPAKAYIHRLSMSEEVVEASEVQGEPPKPQVKCPDCDMCDGSGRILGGLGALLPWVPIKAYRPCPNFVERGGRYQRSGQGLDEIAFGRDSSFKKDK